MRAEEVPLGEVSSSAAGSGNNRSWVERWWLDTETVGW